VALHGIAGSLRAFTAERAPVGVVAPLALALSAGPWALARGDGMALLRAAAVLFLVLLALRIADDLRSLAHDRIAHPGRAVPSGRIAARPLAAGAALLLAAALVLGLPHLSLGLVLLAAYYAAYYAAAERIPLVLRPPLVNAVFLAIPPGVALLAHGAVAGRSAQAALAACFWLSAVGHDYAHEVHAQDEMPPGPPTIPPVLGPRRTAALGLACYAAACAAGLLAARAARVPGGWPPLFVASLVLLYGFVGILLVRLIARPCRERARRLYVSGMACFAVPSLALGLDHLLHW
jgi:4-hydroxybenzoate polyprenyltransferase